MIRRGNMAERRLNHESGRSKTDKVTAGMGTVDEGMQKIARTLIVLGILVIGHIAVGGVCMAGRRLAELMDIAHGCQQRIAHHCEQQHHQRRKAQESAEVAQGTLHGAYVRQAGTR